MNNLTTTKPTSTAVQMANTTGQDNQSSITARLIKEQEQLLYLLLQDDLLPGSGNIFAANFPQH